MSYFCTEEFKYETLSFEQLITLGDKMSIHNHIVRGIVLTVMLGFFVTSANAQAPVYRGALLYSMPWDKSVPPVDSTQSTQVQTAYLWADEAMRLYPEFQIDSFFHAMTWSDTAKTFASNLYQIQDDNPLAYYMWTGDAIKPNPYKGSPGRAEFTFIQNSRFIAGDTMRTFSLLFPEIIADVVIADTLCKQESGGGPPGTSMDMVLVTSTILDEIKGKKVPLCVGYDMRAGKKGKVILSLSDTAYPWATYPVSAHTGQCLQFEYSPEWPRVPSDDEVPRLRDSTGWWIKPGKEYIVFLDFEGFQGDTANGYFTVVPSAEGTSGGMYPVVNGIVQDPWDDFGFGSTNLTVADWKARLRARINSLINP